MILYLAATLTLHQPAAKGLTGKRFVIFEDGPPPASAFLGLGWEAMRLTNYQRIGHYFSFWSNQTHTHYERQGRVHTESP